MFVNDSQSPALVALENLRRAPKERIAMLAAPVFACLAGMKSVGVRSYRYIARDLHFDGIQLRGGSPLSGRKLPHSPHRGQRSPLATFGLARKNDRRRRIQILEPLVRSAAQNIPKLLHCGAYLSG